MLKAFIQTEDGTIKIHDDGAGDFVVTFPDNKQRFFSTWQADYRGSLQRAVDALACPDSVVHLC